MQNMKPFTGWLPLPPVTEGMEGTPRRRPSTILNTLRDGKVQLFAFLHPFFSQPILMYLIKLLENGRQFYLIKLIAGKTP
jgi:hypothetical protein